MDQIAKHCLRGRARFDHRRKEGLAIDSWSVFLRTSQNRPMSTTCMHTFCVGESEHSPELADPLGPQLFVSLFLKGLDQQNTDKTSCGAVLQDLFMLSRLEISSPRLSRSMVRLVPNCVAARWPYCPWRQENDALLVLAGQLLSGVQVAS